MKLQLRMVPDTAFGPQLVLCDESGKALPAQCGLCVSNEADKLPTVTVTFHIKFDVVDGVELCAEPGHL